MIRGGAAGYVVLLERKTVCPTRIVVARAGPMWNAARATVPKSAIRNANERVEVHPDRDRIAMVSPL